LEGPQIPSLQLRREDLLSRNRASCGDCRFVFRTKRAIGNRAVTSVFFARSLWCLKLFGFHWSVGTSSVHYLWYNSDGINMKDIVANTLENNVGILAMEVYFPSSYVTQRDLEVANNVSAGKYTMGLGQEAMAFTGDAEDINSVALTVVHNLLEKYSISPTEIGRLEVGTESLVDKSKSTKTVLMSLFAASGNTNIEGATVVNACYGGTASLMNALSWVDSSAWDGRYAIVVAADIAVYAEGPARPTGGCGAVAMLVGRDAPLQFDMKSRTTYAADVWDFFKPKLDSEYPVVNGAHSQTCFLTALDDCYTRFVTKSKQMRGREISVADTDYFVFHAPYNKLVQKSFGRLLYQDMLSGAAEAAPIEQWKNVSPKDTYEDKGLESAMKKASEAQYQQKVALAAEVSRQTGNTYTASVWMNMANLTSELGEDLAGKRVVLFSYGSGALASMMTVIPNPSSVNPRFSLEKMQSVLRISERLQKREKLTPADMNTALNAREQSHGLVPFQPSFLTDRMLPGTYHLVSISEHYERFYRRKPLEAEQVFGGPLQG
jgi:hydroxymethylglutaryl-CoA synthase